MAQADGGLGLSEVAWERLRREQGYLFQARTLFRQDSDDELIQMAFAENQDADDHIGVIRQFVALVDKGITPPPHILASVAAGFRVYLDGSGGKSLDQAFCLKPKQRIGHPLAHRAEKEKRGQIAYVMWCLRREAELRGELLSIENAASAVINRFNLRYQEDTLKKDYIEMRADDIFGQAAEVMQMEKK